MKSLIALIAISLTVSSVFAKSPDEDSLRITSYQDWDNVQEKIGKLNVSNERFSKHKLLVPGRNLDLILDYVDAFEDKNDLLNILKDKYDMDLMEEARFNNLSEDDKSEYLEGVLEALKMPPSND
jgi:hypothetical protein